MRKYADHAVRLFSKFCRNTETGCWEWQGYRLTNGGYGRFMIDGRNWYAHVAAYTLLVEPVPDGYELDHLCRNTACVNPAHLEVVTHRENVLRGVGACAQHARKTHCPQGHEYTPENTYLSKRGQRSCRTCAAQRAKAS